MSRGIIYVLTNPSFPDLVKIGKTNDIHRRVDELYTTAVPTPFDCEFAYEVDDYENVERAIHKAFSGNRINKNREFFRISPELIKDMFSFFNGATLVTQKVEAAIQSELTQADKEASEKERKRNRNFNFTEMGIPFGSEIFLASNPDIKAKVANDRQVEYEGELWWLTSLTAKLMDFNTYRQPLVYWKFGEKSLLELYHVSMDS